MSLGDRIMAAVRAFKDFEDDRVQPSAAYENRYSMLWSFYDGSWLESSLLPKVGAPLYENARLVLKHTDAVTSLYRQFVYTGDLSTDGGYLPDGTRGAIPIDPQTGNKTGDKLLLAAFAELFSIWQYRQYMSLRPTLGAILGNVLTELVDDRAAGVVMPHTIWPGFTPLRDLELDYAGNVKAYAVDYHVVIEAREASAFGPRREYDEYQFRKEVTSEEFRYYKNGKPFDYPALGPAVQRNPYGFAPAVWDRHEITFGNQGTAAIQKSMIQLMQLNALFSQAIDYSAIRLGSPVGVIGGYAGDPTKNKRMTMPKGVVSAITGNSEVDEELEAQRALAEDLHLLPLMENGQFVSIPFDLGQTAQIIDRLTEGIMRENPEAEFGSKLLNLTQATGPGTDRILSPITGKVRDARKNYDPQTLKKLQMSTSMIAHNIRRNYYPYQVMQRRAKRYDPFRVFTLDSYFRGLLDASIPDRPVFPESQDEKISRLVQINALLADPDPWVLKEAGVPEAEVKRILQEKNAAREAMAISLTGVNPQRPEPDNPDNSETPPPGEDRSSTPPAFA